MFRTCSAFVSDLNLLLMTFMFTLAPPQASVAEAEPYRNALEIFERRIAPLMRSPNPSSCSECHLSGVDLKDYIRDSPEKTFVSLRDQGLINLEEPSKSKILDLIRMSEPNSPLMTQQTRQMELEAFTAWLEVSCQSERLVNAPPSPKEELAAPSVPVEVIRHARKDRVFDSFVANVWNQIERCAGCHSGRNPDLKKLIDKHGEQVWWAFDAPEQTFNSIIEREYIDVRSPEMSWLLMKPTMQIDHGGGKKMEIGDQGYKQFRRFIEDYAAVVQGQYSNAAELPEATEVERIGSGIWFKVSPTPEVWADKLLGVLVFPFDEERGTFSETPTAESDRRVWGKGKLWQHNLILLAPKGTTQARRLREERRLPEGRYLVKFFCDPNGELEEDWQVELNDERFFVGQLELTTDWPVGYQQMVVVEPPES
jgi:hypothetical protein